MHAHNLQNKNKMKNYITLTTFLLVLIAEPEPSWSYQAIRTATVAKPISFREKTSMTQTVHSKSTAPTMSCSLFSSATTSTRSNRSASPSLRSLSAVKKAVLAFAAAIVTFFNQRILWPGSGPDKAFPDAPLPSGNNGCPLYGSNAFAGSSDYGVGVIFTKLFQRMGRPKLFRFYTMGMPMVSVTGTGAIRSILKTEFRDDGVGTLDMQKNCPNFLEIFGSKSVLYENDKARHMMLRRLVGGAMSPDALVQSVPAIERAANSQIDRVVGAYSVHGKTVTMHDVCNDFTVDVAWRQILGLDLNEEEAGEFHKQCRLWMNGMFNPLYFVPFKLPFVRRTKTYQAKDYMVRLVESKVSELERHGPDGSTLSNMYFATDDDGSTRLSRQELIDNALILIVAGSETSSSTLVNTMLLLGLHKDILRKLQVEQKAVIEKYGTSELTKDMLDKDCIYLDAVIRESMRIRPIPAMEVRQTQQTIILDGEQIPKKNYIYANVRATHDQDPSVRENDTDDHMDLMRGYKPERWLDSNTKPKEYIPWGMGARRCLGEKLAVTEMKIFLATFARRIQDFDLEDVSTAEDVNWKRMSVIPFPDDGVVIRPTALP